MPVLSILENLEYGINIRNGHFVFFNSLKRIPRPLPPILAYTHLPPPTRQKQDSSILTTSSNQKRQSRMSRLPKGSESSDRGRGWRAKLLFVNLGFFSIGRKFVNLFHTLRQNFRDLPTLIVDIFPNYWVCRRTGFPLIPYDRQYLEVPWEIGCGMCFRTLVVALF